MREALLVLRGKKQGEIFLLSDKGQTIVGRGEKCEIQLNDPSISRRHFCITKQGDQFFLQDMGSANGTLINNKRSLWQEINVGDTISCGAIQLQFITLTPEEQANHINTHDKGVNDKSTFEAVIATEEHPINIKSTLLSKYDSRKGSLKEYIPSLGDSPAEIIFRKNRLEPTFSNAKDIEKLTQSLATLYKISELLHRPIELKPLAQELLQTILKITKAQRACLLFKKSEDEELEIIAAQTADTSPLSMFSLSRTIINLAIDKGTATVSSDAMSDQRFCRDEKASVILHNIRSVMCVPLEGRERILGALYVDSLISSAVFDTEELELLTAIGRQAGLAVERTLLQETICRSEEKYRTIFQKAPFAIILVNRTGRILDINPVGIQSIIGGNIQTIINETSVLDLFPDARPSLKKLLENSEAFDAKEMICRNLQGNTVIVNLRGIPLLNDSEQIEGAIIISEDITEAKKLQSQIIQQDKMATVGLLAAGVAHEFNNIVAGMMGYAQLMQMGKKTPERLAEVVVEQCSRARQIIERLLNFSRRKDVPRELVDLVILLEDVFQLVERELMKNNIHIDKRFNKAPRVMAHAGELQQVFLNLVMNAMQAIGSNGTLTVILLCENPWIKIIFKDSGPGMPKEILSRIFEPFFTTKSQKGNGLGLSVSYTIIKSYNGDIFVESEVGKGATFTIQLPLPEGSLEFNEINEEGKQTTPIERESMPERLNVRIEEHKQNLNKNINKNSQ